MHTHRLHLLVVGAASMAVLAGVAFGADASAPAALPRLMELGSVNCIPCRKMAPILEELRQGYAGKLDVVFVDVVKDPSLAQKYGIEVIPTQIFFGADGRELFRHIGFFAKDDILAKWGELGVDLGKPAASAISRWEPAQQDTRPRSAICFLCDRDVVPETAIVVRSKQGDVRLCSPHCFMILYSAYTGDREELESIAFATDYRSGELVPVREAHYLYLLDEQTGRPSIMAFARRETALEARRDLGGSILSYPLLKERELATRCAFCDRAVYPEDAVLVKAGGVYTWACCSNCAMGVAARTGADLEVHVPDRLTGEPIVVKIANGSVESISPETAVAWFGQRIKPDGTRGSAGCFHQGFFASADNLAKWLEANPLETGEMVVIPRILANKMAMSPEQIQKASKIRECVPKP